METIEQALISGGSTKAVKRKLGIDKNAIYGLRDKDGNVTTNMDCTVEVAEEFYTNLYSSSNNSDGNDRDRGIDELDIPPVRKALAAMQRGKAAGEDHAGNC